KLGPRLQFLGTQELQPGPELLQRRVPSCAKLLGKPCSIAPIDREGHGLAADLGRGGREAVQPLQQGCLSPESKARRHTGIITDIGWKRDGRRIVSVLQHHDFPVEAPVHETLRQEQAWCGQEIETPQEVVKEQSTCAELILVELRKAHVTFDIALASAKAV